MLGGTAALASIWFLLAAFTLFGWQAAAPAPVEEPAAWALNAQFESVPVKHTGSEFPLLIRFSQPVHYDADTLDRRAITVSAGSLTSVRRVDDRSDLWELRIVPDSRDSVLVRLDAQPGCVSAGSICTKQQIPLSNRPGVGVPGSQVSARFLDAPGHHSGLDQIAIRIELSESISVGARALGEHGLEVSGGSVRGLRKVGDRSDLWEAIVVPESSADLVVSLVRPSACASDDLECINLQRFGEGISLTIPPATIHLTFDDGPDRINTPIILDILKRYDARATFFVVGRSAVSFPELIERIVAEGHTLGNHTWAHDDLVRLSEEAFNRTLLRTQAALGEHATDCFRPPGYHFNEETIRRAANLGLRMVLNTGDTSDWLLPGADVITQKIIASAKPNVILVLHDGGGDRSQTIRALEAALSHLSEQRYVFEPVCE